MSTGVLDADRLFNIANALALAGWVCILFVPRARWASRFISPVLIPALLAIAYLILLIAFFDPKGFASFSSLAGLASLQGSPWLLLAGWLHYLAFDLFVGSWEVRKAQEDGIAHLWIVPSLLLTFMAGPAGLLLFIGTRYAVRRKLFA